MVLNGVPSYSPITAALLTANSKPSCNKDSINSAAAEKAAISEALSKRIIKTKLCNHYLRGKCIRANTCCFAHSVEELRSPPNLQKTRLCVKWVTTRACYKGEQCK